MKKELLIGLTVSTISSIGLGRTIRKELDKKQAKELQKQQEGLENKKDEIQIEIEKLEKQKEILNAEIESEFKSEKRKHIRLDTLYHKIDELYDSIIQVSEK